MEYEKVFVLVTTYNGEDTSKSFTSHKARLKYKESFSKKHKQATFFEYSAFEARKIR